MFTPLALIITAICSAFLWKETLNWGRSNSSLFFIETTSFPDKLVKDNPAYLHHHLYPLNPLFIFLIGLQSDHIDQPMKVDKVRFLIFMAVLAGMFCWCVGFIACCGARRKMAGKTQQQMSRTLQERKRRSIQNALPVIDQ